MIGPVGYLLWVAGFLAEVYVVARAALQGRDLLRYLSLNLYMAFAALVTAGQYVVIRQYGLASLEYHSFYYYTDSLLTVLLYFAIMQFYHKVFKELGFSRYVRVATVLLLVATAGFSYAVVNRNVDQMVSRFIVELSQNLYFVGLVLTYLLWLAVLKLHETRTRLIQLVLSLGIYFSATAAVLALRNMFPELLLVIIIQPLAGTFLPLAWAYTFTRIPEEARLATAQVAMPQR